MRKENASRRGAPSVVVLAMLSLMLSSCGETSTNGACRGQTDCGGVCADLDSDSNHCGMCGFVCPSQSCSNGSCVQIDVGGVGSTGAGGANGAVGAVGAGGVATASGVGAGGVSSSGAVNGAGGAASGVGGTGGGAMSSAWHGAVATALTESVLENEYIAWKGKYAAACPDGSWVVIKDGSIATGGGLVSEGIAYGMLLSAAFDDREAFDGLWRYYNDHLDENGLMNWATGLCDAPGNNMANAATDADLDAAMALLQAAVRWPDGTYLGDAEALGQQILAHETDECGGLVVLLPGDAWGGCNDSDTRINPSYFAPGYYRVFARRFPAQAAAWNALLEDSYTLYASYQATSPLVPDWDNSPYGDEAGPDNYWWDACRTPWRVAVDYGLSEDGRATAFLGSVSAWVEANGGIGSPAGKPNNSAFNGAFALTGIADQAKLDAYVSSWLGSGGDDSLYFQATLRVLYLTVAGGRFTVP
jgi:hypothetical protein